MRAFTSRHLVLFIGLFMTLSVHRTATASEIEKLLTLPENKVDVGIVALTLAKEFYPNLDVAAYSSRIDLLAEKVRRLARGTQDPEQRIRVLNTVLFRQEGIHYDRTPFARSKQDYYFLNGILDTKQGLCYTMPLLYVAVAQRLGYPIYPVAAPDHLFARYVNPDFKEQNIETTSGGKYFSDDMYAEDFAIGFKGRASGSYLRTLSYREFIGEIVAANAYFYAQRGNIRKSIRYFELAVKLDPRFADHYSNLASVYQRLSKSLSGEAAMRYQVKAQQAAEKAKELGFVSDKAIALGRKTRGG